VKNDDLKNFVPNEVLLIIKIMIDFGFRFADKTDISMITKIIHI